MKKVAVATACAVVFGASACMADFKAGYGTLNVDGGDSKSAIVLGTDMPFAKETVRFGVYLDYYFFTETNSGDDDAGFNVGLLAGYQITPKVAVDLRAGLGVIGDYTGTDTGLSANYTFADKWFVQLEHMIQSGYEHSTLANVEMDSTKTVFYAGKAF